MFDFFHFGQYGGYIFAAYAVFVIVLAIDALAPFWQRRQILRELAARLRRETTRKISPENQP